MMRSFATSLVLLASGGAWAASALEANRAQAEGAHAAVVGVRDHQAALRLELNQLAARIETLKAARRGALRPGSELEADLRHSQELSGALSDLARQLSTAEQTAERANAALLGALSQSLQELKARLESSSDRETRRALMTQMRSLRAEREQVRAQLPLTAIPSLDANTADAPEELLEQADAVRDSEDKVRSRMQALKARIQELKEERELDTRMSDFMGEQALFDEQDRRLRKAESDSRSNLPASLPAPQTAGATSPGNGFTGAPPAAPGPATLALPPAPTAANPLDGTLEAQDVGQLEQALRRLNDTASELEERARNLESRARQLQ